MARYVGQRGDRGNLSRRARRPTCDDRGETLLEILITIVIMGAVFSAFFVAISSSSSASTAHRNYVTADALLRDYAEAAKAGARAACPTSTTYTTTTTSLPAGFSVTNGTGFTGTVGVCPADTSSVQEAQITVTLPSGVTRSLQIDVRTP
jgi:type II secretory pathway pseudopilin PulG